MTRQLACAAVLTGVLGLCMLGGTHREAPLVGYDKLGPSVAALEDAVANEPNNPTHLANLVQAYVDRGSPGLAIATLQRAPSAVGQQPQVAHLWALALMRAGHASAALNKEQSALATCHRDGCAPWVLAASLRHEQFLSSLVDQGVEDYRRDADATRAAYAQISRATVAVLDLHQRD